MIRDEAIVMLLLFTELLIYLGINTRAARMPQHITTIGLKRKECSLHQVSTPRK